MEDGLTNNDDIGQRGRLGEDFAAEEELKKHVL